jgi:hypothetical protein
VESEVELEKMETHFEQALPATIALSSTREGPKSQRGIDLLDMSVPTLRITMT